MSQVLVTINGTKGTTDWYQEWPDVPIEEWQRVTQPNDAISWQMVTESMTRIGTNKWSDVPIRLEQTIVSFGGKEPQRNSCKTVREV